jgi:hypothetical protein
MASQGVERFEGAASGTTISTANTAFSNVSGSATATFATDQFYEGSRSGKIVAAANTKLLRWDLPAAVTSLYARRFYRIDAVPTSGNPMKVLLFRSGTTESVFVRFITSGSGRFELVNGSTVVATSAIGQVIPANAWFRMELGVDLTAGTCEMRAFLGANVEGTTPDVTLSGTANATATLDTIVDGFTLARTNTMWLDNMQQDDAGWVGPSSVSGALGPASMGLTAVVGVRKDVSGALVAPMTLGVTQAAKKAGRGGLVAPMTLGAALTPSLAKLDVGWIQLTLAGSGGPMLRASWVQLDAPGGGVTPSPALNVSWVELQTDVVYANVKVRRSSAWSTRPVKIRSTGAWR